MWRELGKAGGAFGPGRKERVWEGWVEVSCLPVCLPAVEGRLRGGVLGETRVTIRGLGLPLASPVHSVTQGEQPVGGVAQVQMWGRSE